ncbi:MAG: hypothetical protein GTO63_37425, partial [Anaerolineae bacterium]|nr:hypothetical protein [Anaerolineae bacterium]NIO00445.1 hypothetical protein [Anaerolineae bacterium]NIQ83205.1 hypothetical protein [Anaerolineae bacterium]
MPWGWGIDLVTVARASECEDETGASWGPANHGMSFADGAAFFRAENIDLSGFAGTEGSETPYWLELHDSAGKEAAGF